MLFRSSALSAAAAVAAPQSAHEDLTPVAGTFSRFNYDGFTMLVPSGTLISKSDQEAVVKAADGTFGLSLKVEKDAAASPEAALQLCSRLVSDLRIKGARVTRVSIHGMAGGRVQGTVEGAPISVVVLDGSGKYVKLVVINMPDRADWADMAIDSLSRQ